MENVNQALETEHSGDDRQKYLTFIVDEQVYGFPVSNVVEIIKVHSITALPEMPSYTKGIINLRGEIVPLIDVSMRFGRAEKEYTEHTCIIVADIQGTRTGLIVDAVDEVMDIANDSVCELPSVSEHSYPAYVMGIGRISDSSMVLLLDLEMLVQNKARA